MSNYVENLVITTRPNDNRRYRQTLLTTKIIKFRKLAYSVKVLYFLQQLSNVSYFLMVKMPSKTDIEKFIKKIYSVVTVSMIRKAN